MRDDSMRDDETKDQETAYPPVVQPDEIIPPFSNLESSDRSSNQFENFDQRTKVFERRTESVSLLPGFLAAIVGTVVGSVVGGIVGILGGPFGVLLGIGLGALGGFLFGFGLGSIGWLLIPKILRIIIATVVTLIILHWLIGKFFGLSIWAL